MGVEDNYFQITDLDSNTTFYAWVNKENTEIIEKLNLMNIYGASAGSSSIEVTVGSTGNSFDAGDAVIDLADTIKGVTVSGNLILSGLLTVQDGTTADTIVTSVNGQTGAVTVTAATGPTGAAATGITGPTGESPDPLFVSGNLLINGNYDIWQRGNTFTSSVTGSSIHFADRWRRHVNSDNSITVTSTDITRKDFPDSQTDVLGRPTYYACVNQSMTGTAGSDDLVGIENVLSDGTRFLDETLHFDGYLKGSTEDAGLTAYLRRVPDGSTFFVDEFTELIPVGTTWTPFFVSKDVKYRAGNTYVVGITAGGGGNIYTIDGISAPALNLERGYEYTFDLSNAGLTAHPFRISETSDGTHATGGTEYLFGVSKSGITAGNTGAYLNLKVLYGSPTNLFYYCPNHSGMGATISISGEAATTDGFVSLGINTIGYPSGETLELSNFRAFVTQGTTLTKSPVREETDSEEELKKCSEFYQRSYNLGISAASSTMIDTTNPDLSPIRFVVDPDFEYYYDFPVKMRKAPTVTLYSPYTGVQTDGYNRSSGNDIRLSSGTVGYNSEIRLHSSGASTLLTTVFDDGIIFDINSGCVVFDQIFVHYVADSEYNL